LPESERVPLLQKTKIGVNIHNSTGPINFRAFYLPANGVLQICDNKSHLGKMFELGKEVAGYDDIDEAIELCRYYLAHDAERREIAAAGFERAVRDYNEVASFRSVVTAVEEFRLRKEQPTERGAHVHDVIGRHRRRTRSRRFLYAAAAPIAWPVHNSGRILRGAWRRSKRLYENLLYRWRARGAQGRDADT
jgi:hypothetical protein